jgi:hypothetical protein
MEEDFEVFAKAAEEQFGDKVSSKPIHINKEDLNDLCEHLGVDITEEYLNNYHQVWILDGKCPNCGAELLGLFGSFKWGLVHGEGYCSNCNSVNLKYYHYFNESKKPLMMMSLIGF